MKTTAIVSSHQSHGSLSELILTPRLVNKPGLKHARVGIRALYARRGRDLVGVEVAGAELRYHLFKGVLPKCNAKIDSTRRRQRQSNQTTKAFLDRELEHRLKATTTKGQVRKSQ